MVKVLGWSFHSRFTGHLVLEQLSREVHSDNIAMINTQRTFTDVAFYAYSLPTYISPTWELPACAIPSQDFDDCPFRERV